MYQIKFNNAIIYDPRLDDRIIRGPAVHLAAGEPGSLDFTIDSDHPAVSQLTKMIGTLELLQDGDTIYRGRIIRDKKDFYNSRRVETEGLLASLNDSIIPPFSFPGDFLNDADYQAAAESGNVVAFFLGWLIDQHNAQVAVDRKITLGAVTVADSNNYISRSASDYATTWETIKSKLIEGSLGGYLMPRYEPDGTYLDYVADFTLTNTQPVEFGWNLLDLATNVDATQVYTAILPLGKDGLTIEDRPNDEIAPGVFKSGKIIYSAAGRAKYGNITRVVTWDDVTVSHILEGKALDELTGSGVLMENSITVKACDLHCDDDTVASFRVGRKVILTSAPHDIGQSFALVELEPDILDPGNTVITIGSAVLSQTDRNQADKISTAEEIDKKYTETDQKISDVVDETSRQITEAVQNAQGIIFTALDEYVKTGDFTTYQQTVSSSLEILSNSIELKLQKVTTDISEVGNDLQQQITDITKYFRFTDGGLYIGETGNEVLLRLDNDVIQFLRNNMPGLWMDENGLHTESVRTDRIQIGSAEIVTENGRITLRKVVN